MSWQVREKGKKVEVECDMYDKFKRAYESKTHEKIACIDRCILNVSLNNNLVRYNAL